MFSPNVEVEWFLVYKESFYLSPSILYLCCVIKLVNLKFITVNYLEIIKS